MDKTKLKLSGEIIYPGITPRSPLSTGRGVFIDISLAHPPTTQELGKEKKKQKQI